MTSAPITLPELPAATVTGWRDEVAQCLFYGQGDDMERLHTADAMQAYATLAVEQDRVGRWLPIEEAPRDGSCLLVGDGDGREAYPAFWHDGSQCYGHRGGEGWFSEDERTNLLCASNVHPVAYMPWPLSPPAPPFADDGGKSP